MNNNRIHKKKNSNLESILNDDQKLRIKMCNKLERFDKLRYISPRN